MMARAHNKKRNTGLLYEFLVRHISEGIISGDERKVKDATRLLKKHFKRGSELHREFKLFNALVNTTVVSPDVAQKIVSGAREAAKKYDVQRLDREKSLLIKAINYTFKDETFYDKRVDEYRAYATVQTLLNDWREPIPSDITRLALFESEMVQWLMSDKKKNVLEEQRTAEVDDLVVNLMIKKVNGKYRGLLNKEQIELMRGYVASIKTGDQTALKESIDRVKAETIAAIDSHLKKEESAVAKQRLAEVRTLIDSSTGDNIDDRRFTQFLRVAQLKHEILGESR